MKLKSFLCMTLAVVVAGLMAVSGVQAAITTWGNLDPTTDPSTWTTSTTAYVGKNADGGLTINSGSTVTSKYIYAGNDAGKTGTITVDGVNSALTASQRLYFGYSGTGVLNITNGGTVYDAYYGHLGWNAGSTGVATVDGNGSSWKNGSYLYVGTYGTGSLKVTNGGTVTARYTSIGDRAGSIGAMTIDGLGSTLSLTGSTNGGSLLVGSYGTGTLMVTNGATVQAPGYYYLGIGRYSGADGTVIIDGAGSSASAAYINVGSAGTGRLSILNGANLTITSANGYDSSIGGTATGSGIAVVDGPGSAWTNASSFGVGGSGTAKLSISNGGLFTAASLSIGSSSTLTTDVGYGSTLSVGTGGLTNNGTIRLVAGAGTGAGTYAPIFNAGSWSGNAPQALGGVWNGANHTVTVTAATTANAGTPTTIDLATVQRVLITDPATGHAVGAAFQATTVPTNLTITATAIAALAGLKGQLAAGTAVLSAWNFDITQGYISGNPVYLSLFAGPNQSLSTLGVWHYDGTTWSAFTANDLAYDGTYASFTVTGFSGYALSGTAPVPVPAAVWLLGSGLAGLVGMRRRMFKK